METRVTGSEQQAAAMQRPQSQHLMQRAPPTPTPASTPTEENTRPQGSTAVPEGRQASSLFYREQVYQLQVPETNTT